jgi:hypothetical protein
LRANCTHRNVSQFSHVIYTVMTWMTHVRFEFLRRNINYQVRSNVDFEAVPIETVKPGLPFVVKITNKKKRERNAYYIRRGLREGFLEHRKQDLLQIAPAPEAK